MRYLMVLLTMVSLSGCGASPTSQTTGVPGDSATPTGTFAPTLTDTPTPATPTPSAPEITIAILGCDTGLDIAHGMGEVTNAYVTVSNVGKGDALNVCATLSAGDEDRPHPDKTQCVPVLPAGYQVTHKLTVDTRNQVDAYVKVDVTLGQGDHQQETEPACRGIDPRVEDKIKNSLGMVTRMSEN